CHVCLPEESYLMSHGTAFAQGSTNGGLCTGRQACQTLGARECSAAAPACTEVISYPHSAAEEHLMSTLFKTTITGTLALLFLGTLCVSKATALYGYVRLPKSRLRGGDVL